MRGLLLAVVLGLTPAAALACNSWDQNGECADLFQFDEPAPAPGEAGHLQIMRQAIAANIACLREMNAHVGPGPVDTGPACRRWYRLDQRLRRAIGSPTP